MPTARKAGRRGRLPVKPPGERFNIQYLSAYLPAPLPAPVYPVDVSAGITDWGMLGNGPDPACSTHPNGVGDCTFAGRQHYRMAKAAAGRETEQWESSNDLVAEYLTYDHGQDQGAQIADLLLYWYNAGTILAFAPLDHTNPAEVDSAMAAFHGVYVGVNLSDDADSLFEQHQPWTTASGEQPDPNEGHCLVPGTRILTDDLQWVPIEVLRPGDGLVGFDESAGVGRSSRRKYRRAVVEASETLNLPCYDVEFDDGSTVTCSCDHLWLVKNGNLTMWQRTDQMQPTVTLVSKPLRMWETDTSHGAGYLAGAFDGEGWCNREKTSTVHGVGFAQRENEMLEAVTTALKERGFAYHDYINHKPQPESFTRSEDIHTLAIAGKRPEILRFLGSVRPPRLLPKFSADRLGSVYYGPWMPVRRITPAGQRPVIALQTSTRTFLAEGFLSHNCIVKVGADGSQTDSWVTWGALQQSTRGWTTACLEEAWVIISQEDANATNLNIAALRADIDALHGTGG